MDPNSYEALRERAAWIDLTGRGKIRATGDDRARLLHNMTTNHIQNLIPGQGCYAFFLTAQGRIISDANIFCKPDYLLIDTEPESKQQVMDHLEKFIIADDVSLHDFTSDYATINVEGPGAETLLKELQAPVAHSPCSVADWSHREVAHVSYTGQPGYSVFMPNELRSEFIEQISALGAPEADLETADVVRIENGRPRYGVDISSSTLPQETQMMHAVHSAKGCYVGQEIVERVRSRGHVNKVLSALDIDSATPPPAGTIIHLDGKEVGTITSAAFSPARNKVVAMAIVRAEALTAALTVAGATASVRRAVT